MVTEINFKQFNFYLINAGLKAKTRIDIVYRMKKFFRNKDEFSKDTSTDWITDLLEKDKNATANQYIKSFKHWGKFKNLDWTKDIKHYKEQRHIPLIFSNQEILDFLALKPLEKQNLLNFKKWKVFWSLCAFTGARTGEIRKLTSDSVDFGRKCLVIQQSKTGIPRLIPLLPQIEDLVFEYLKLIKTDSLSSSTLTLSEKFSLLRAQLIEIQKQANKDFFVEFSEDKEGLILKIKSDFYNMRKNYEKR